MAGMEKSRKTFFILLILLCSLLSGCGRDEEASVPVPPRLVTQVHVFGTRGHKTVQRSYSSPRKMDAILTYLRRLEPYGRPSEDPERLLGDSYKVVVVLSDGSTHTYRLRAGRYISLDCRRWKKLDETQASRLFPLLLTMKSDSKGL